MTLDEAIKRYADNAEYERTHGNLQGYLEFKRLEKWLKELKQLREQEPCEDAISRQAVLNTLDNMDSVLDEDRTVETYKELLTACYKDLPSVTSVYKKEWIPVTERLPKDRREVLVTAYWHETYQVMMGSYFGDGLWWCVPFNNSGEHMQKLKPKAWMPLPEPYKTESEDKE